MNKAELIRFYIELGMEKEQAIHYVECLFGKVIGKPIFEDTEREDKGGERNSTV